MWEKSRILYSGPNGARRENGTVWLSYDEGANWPVRRVLRTDGFGYSRLTVLPRGAIGWLFETAGANRIVFARFTLDCLTGGKDRAEGIRGRPDRKNREWPRLPG